MATTVSYGSISIVDITDIGEFSVYPKCNLPSSVIYNPDQSGTSAYEPNWGTTNLVVTPSVWYAGSRISNTDADFTWQRQVGAGEITALTTNESMTSSGTNKGTLTVTENKFNDNVSMLTYIVTATYREPTSQQLLTAQGEITFTITRQASVAKTITITGDSIFKYDENRQIIGGTQGVATIVLDKRSTNVTLSAWQYKDASGNWVNYPNSNVNSSLTVRSDANTFHNASIFNNEKAIIRLVAASPDSDIYDMHVITNVYDGAIGQGTITATLTNDDQMIPFTTNGTTETGDFSLAVSRLIIYRGGDGDVTSEYTITQTATNVSKTASQTTVANDTVKVTGFTNNATTGSVTFSAVKTSEGANAIPITKTFTVVKVSSGADGVSPTIYSVEPDALNLNKSAITTGTPPTVTYTYTPATVTFKCYQQQGTTKEGYRGALRIYENVLANNITSSTPYAYQSAAEGVTPANNYSYTYTPSSSATSIVCRMYASGSFNTLLDTQTISITKDGEKGEQGQEGAAGADAINIALSDYLGQISTNYRNITTLNQVIEFDFRGLEGTTRVPTRIVPTIPTLLGCSYNQQDYRDATATSDGHISYTIPANTDITSYGRNGNITFTFRLNYDNNDKAVNMTYDFAWLQSRNPKDGQNAVILQLVTPNGDIIENGEGTIEIEAKVLDGSADMTSSSTYVWKKFSSDAQSADGYDVITGETDSSLTVTADMIDGYASFKCEATYDNNIYVQYMSIKDYTDPIQVTVLSSVGDKLINGNGVGALYAKVFRNDEEIDEMPSERFFTTLPTSGNKNGDYAYWLDTTNKTVVLKKYNNGWQNETKTFSATYEWFYRNKDGTRIQNGDSDGKGGTINTPASTGKVIYIDGDLVDKKLIIDCKVTV